jgi:hypothetical protein
MHNVDGRPLEDSIRGTTSRSSDAELCESTKSWKATALLSSRHAVQRADRAVEWIHLAV